MVETAIVALQSPAVQSGMPTQAPAEGKCAVDAKFGAVKFGDVLLGIISLGGKSDLGEKESADTKGQNMLFDLSMLALATSAGASLGVPPPISAEIIQNDAGGTAAAPIGSADANVIAIANANVNANAYIAKAAFAGQSEPNQIAITRFKHTPQINAETAKANAPQTHTATAAKTAQKADAGGAAFEIGANPNAASGQTTAEFMQAGALKMAIGEVGFGLPQPAKPKPATAQSVFIRSEHIEALKKDDDGSNQHDVALNADVKANQNEKPQTQPVQAISRGMDVKIKAEKQPADEAISLEKPQPAAQGQQIVPFKVFSGIENDTTEIIKDAGAATQIKSAVTKALDEGKSQFVLQLQPEGLGKVTVRMRMEDGKLSLHIAADNDTAQKLISSQVAELKSSLEHVNVHLSDIQVASEQHSGSVLGQNFEHFGGFNAKYRGGGFEPAQYAGYAEKEPDLPQNKPQAQVIGYGILNYLI